MDKYAVYNDVRSKLSGETLKRFEWLLNYWNSASNPQYVVPVPVVPDDLDRSRTGGFASGRAQPVVADLDDEEDDWDDGSFFDDDWDDDDDIEDDDDLDIGTGGFAEPADDMDRGAGGFRRY